MKNIRKCNSLILVAALLCLTSCKKDSEGGKVTLKVQFEQNATQKIYLADGNTVNYFPGEKIRINNSEYDVVNATVEVSSASDFVAVYPAGNTGFTSAGGSVLIPPTQIYSETNGVQNIQAPMVAYLNASSGTLMFRNTASLLRVRVQNPSSTESFELEQISAFEAENTIFCSGKQSITFSGSTTTNNINVSSSLSGSFSEKRTYVHLDFEPHQILAPGASKDYYLVIAPFVNRNLHVDMVGTVNGGVRSKYGKTSPVAVTLARSAVGNVTIGGNDLVGPVL